MENRKAGRSGLGHIQEQITQECKHRPDIAAVFLFGVSGQVLW